MSVVNVASLTELCVNTWAVVIIGYRLSPKSVNLCILHAAYTWLSLLLGVLILCTELFWCTHEVISVY